MPARKRRDPFMADGFPRKFGKYHLLAPLAQGRPVAVLAPNTHVLLEANYGVPWAGSALVAINTRLSAGEVAYILEHCGAAVLVLGFYIAYRLI